MIVICTDTDSLSVKETAILNDFLTKERLEKLSKKKEDRSSALVSYALIGLLLKTPQAEFGKGSHGKPYLKAFPNASVSLSHTKGAAMVGISTQPIGVDIENTNRTVSDAVFSRMCTKEEKARYTRIPKSERIALWTLKESYLKLSGSGLTKPLSSVSFSSLHPPVCSDRQVITFYGTCAGYAYAFAGLTQERVFSLSAKEVVLGVKKLLNL